MTDEQQRPLTQEVNADAVRLAKTLIRTARSGALATLDPTTGAPNVSRVGVSTDIDGTPIVLISRIAAHTAALLHDPRCSLLLGYPGKGDPLAHARISLACEAMQVARDGEVHRRLTFRYLTHQPKAELYAALPDFAYFRLIPKSAALNAGFGRAYVLKRPDILDDNEQLNAGLAELEPEAIAHMNADHGEAVGLYAEHFGKARAGAWRLVGIDAEGIDLADGDETCRVWFEAPLTSPDELRATLVRMAAEARQGLGRSKDASPSS